MSDANPEETSSLVPAGESRLSNLPGGLAARGLALASDLLSRPIPMLEPGEVHCLRGHGDCVVSVAISPDGRYGASGSWDRTVRVWELAGGAELARFEGHADRVASVSFSADGRRVLTGSWDGTARLWDWEKNAEVTRFFEGEGGMVHAVALSPDGRVAACGGGKPYFVLRNVLTGEELRTCPLPIGPVRSLRFSPDGKYLLSGSGQVVVSGAGRDNGTLCLWEVESGQRLWGRADATEPVLSVAFSSDGELAFSSTGWPSRSRLNVTSVWEVGTGTELHRHEAHRQPLFSGRFLPGSRNLLLVGRDRLLRLWDPAEAREIRRFEGHQDAVYSVAVSYDGRYALTGSGDRTVRLWRLPQNS